MSWLDVLTPSRVVDSCPARPANENAAGQLEIVGTQALSSTSSMSSTKKEVESSTEVSASPAFTMQNACIYCPEWRDCPGFPWWFGTCAATGEKKGRRSVCTVPGVGVLQ